MPLLRLLLTLTLPLALGFATDAYAAQDRGITIVPGIKKLALVIGNDYEGESIELKNPLNDAKAMREALKNLGFELMGDDQQDLAGMYRLSTEFGNRLRPGMIGLFYFAGHGVGLGGTNYLLPKNSGIQRQDEVRSRAFDASEILTKMESARTDLNLMILDACRDNPYPSNSRSAGKIGMSVMNGGKGTLIAYATRFGTKSSDGDGDNGLYTGALLKYLTRPGLKVTDVFMNVRRDVVSLTNGDQVPWEENGLLNDFCFAGCGGGPTPSTPPYRPVTPTPAPEPEPEPAPAPRPIPQRQPVAPAPRPAPVAPAVSPSPRATPAAACDDCPEMVRLPGGTFMMGSTAAETGSDQDERPRHSVTVQPFALGKYEVTRAQYATFVDATGYRGGSSCKTYENGKGEDRTGRGWRNPGYSQSGNHPVVCVSLEDAEAYARWLSGKTGRRFRLPTEAEWEYAARAGTDTSRYWGDDPDRACGYANVADQRAQEEYPQWKNIHGCADGAVHTATVGSYRANRLALFDMLGNVLEWTCSAYTVRGYDGDEKTCSKDATARRVLRGGSWFFSPVDVRSARRGMNVPSLRNFVLGFRLAQD